MQQDLHKILSQGPVPDHVRTHRGFHPGIFKSFSQGSVPDHAKASDSISQGSPQDLSRTSQEPPARAFSKAPLRHGICKLCHAKTSWRGSHKEESNLAGSPQKTLHARINNEYATDPELENPAAQTLCESAQPKCTWTCQKSHFMRGCFVW